MPELPEVETIVSYLKHGRQDIPSIVGCQIIQAELLWDKTLAEPDVEGFLSRVNNQLFQEISRRGKFLVLKLSFDWLLIHLRMSGDLYVESNLAPNLSHNRLLVNLNNGHRLVFNDPRKFGRVWLVENPSSILDHLGPEPFDKSLTQSAFHQRLQCSHRKIKPLLMDQAFLAGMGNIYTDEALHMAGIHPTTASSTLSREEADKLLGSIRFVLQEGIKRQGASIDWVYRGGDFQNYFRVYQRTGLPCLQCGTPIERLVIAQRSTHYCPVCQPQG